MRMDEIGWHSIHGSDFMNEREHGAGDWVFLLIKSPCRIFADGEMRQFPAYTWILYTPDAYQKYGADGAEYYDDWMHFAPDAEEEARRGALDGTFLIGTFNQQDLLGCSEDTIKRFLDNNYHNGYVYDVIDCHYNNGNAYYFADIPKIATGMIIEIAMAGLRPEIIIEKMTRRLTTVLRDMNILPTDAQSAM